MNNLRIQLDMASQKFIALIPGANEHGQGQTIQEAIADLDHSIN
ncbi:hypothetical protein [Bombilactobacillus thymidiniphilus]|nr:hypothetical protein [Bombilactobacillus thymidiniphilus]